MTKVLKILEEDGFIKRETDESDRRNTLCYITLKGEAIVEYLINLHKNSELLATDFEK